MKFDWPELTRCCFCLPLRRGVLAFGYLNIIFSAFMVGIYSYNVHHESDQPSLVFHGSSILAPAEISVLIYCTEISFNALLVYGAHKKIPLYIRIFYYFTLTTIVSIILLQILEFSNTSGSFTYIELLSLAFVGLCLQLYLFTLVRSLLIKLDGSSVRCYENTFNQIVIGKPVMNGSNEYDSEH